MNLMKHRNQDEFKANLLFDTSFKMSRLLEYSELYLTPRAKDFDRKPSGT